MWGSLWGCDALRWSDYRTAVCHWGLFTQVSAVIQFTRWVLRHYAASPEAPGEARFCEEESAFAASVNLGSQQKALPTIGVKVPVRTGLQVKCPTQVMPISGKQTLKLTIMSALEMSVWYCSRMMWRSVVFLYMWVSHLHVSHGRSANRRCQSPRKWTHEQFWATMWMLGTEPQPVFWKRFQCSSLVSHVSVPGVFL